MQLKEIHEEEKKRSFSKTMKKPEEKRKCKL